MREQTSSSDRTRADRRALASRLIRVLRTRPGAATGGEVVFSGLGPQADEDGAVPCTEGVPYWTVNRLADAAEQTGGMWLPLYDEACALADMQAAIEAWWAQAVR